MKGRGAILGKRAVAIGLGVLLVVAAVAPAEAYWRGGFWLGLGAGALLTAPLWWPHYAAPYYYPYYYPYPYYAPYPYYPYPAEPYPGYAVPPPATGTVPPPATPPTPTTPTPSPLTPPAPPAPPAGEGSAARTCQTFWVEGHYETHVGSSGQAVTVWIPGGSRQICQ